MLIEKKACFICGGENLTFLCEFLYSFPDAYNTSSNYLLCVCNQCGFVFKGSESSHAEIEEYQRKHNRFEGFNRNFYNYALDYISERYDKNVKILDVGCSVGNLLAALREKGYINLQGIDPSPFCAKYLSEQGIQCRAGSVYDEHKDYENSFDIITLTGVLEHLVSPLEALLNIRQWLKKDAVLFIEVPDAKHYHLSSYNFCNLICAEHFNHFSEETLEYLVSKAGFKIIFRRSSPYKDSIQIVCKSDENCISPEIKLEKDTCESIKISCEKFQAAKKDYIESLKNIRQKKVAVWGLSHYMMLLIEPVFLKQGISIEMIVDTDGNKQGLFIKDIPVVSPKKLYGFDGSLVILNNSSKESILKDIRDKKFLNKIIILESPSFL